MAEGCVLESSKCYSRFLVDVADKQSLAMAEMTSLTAAIYRAYRSSLSPGTENTSPGITSRFEVFYDETLPEVKVGQPVFDLNI